MNSLNQGPAERVYHQLRNDVVRQKFLIGERLMINPLADQYLVSSTPVREALSRLYGEQLIDFRYGHGYFCKVPSLSEMMNLHSLLRVVLIASAAKIDGAGLGELSFRVALPDLAPPNDEDSARVPKTSDQRRAYIERVFDCIADLGGNVATLSVVRNITARTHFVARAVFSHEGQAREMDDIVDSIEDAVSAGDSTSLQISLNLYFDFMEVALPDLLRDLVANRFLGGR